MPLKQRSVRDLQPGQVVRDLFALSEARQLSGKTGPFWALTLQDASGTIEAKIFSPLSLQHPNLAAGLAVLVEGPVQTYRDQPQIVVDRLQVIPESDLDESDYRGLIPMSQVSPDELMSSLELLLDAELKHKPWKAFCRKVLAAPEIRERFKLAPGAKAIHHAYAGGLLTHTLAVCRVCMALCDLYPEIDRQALLVAAAFHDLGKAWELTGGLSRDFTDEGRLLGHILIGLEILAPFLAKAKDLEPELKTHLRHLLASHHGEYQFGSPRRPKTAEAMVLHYADNLDAKLNTVAEAFDDEAGQGTWSPFVRPLERFLFKPTPTPDPRRAKKNDAEVQQCLLPLKA